MSEATQGRPAAQESERAGAATAQASFENQALSSNFPRQDDTNGLDVLTLLRKSDGCEIGVSRSALHELPGALLASLIGA
jgi:hypothetical protein